LISLTPIKEDVLSLNREIAHISQESLEGMLSRRKARRLALQILFCNEFLQEDINSVSERIAETLQKELNHFTRKLIEKTYTHRDEMDQLILTHLRDWDIERIGTLDRVLMRMSLVELLYFPDIPIEVTFDEALELSKEFISNKSSRFINGILDTIFKTLQDEKRIKKSSKARIPPRPNQKFKSLKGIKQ
jgi:N utilization substance protein B